MGYGGYGYYYIDRDYIDYIDRVYRELYVAHHIIYWMELADIGLSEGLASYYIVGGLCQNRKGTLFDIQLC